MNRAAAETLRVIAADPRHLGTEIGGIAVLHTWGQAIQHHPHVHCIVPDGGLSPDRRRWIACPPGFFLSVKMLGRLFGDSFSSSSPSPSLTNACAPAGSLRGTPVRAAAGLGAADLLENFDPAEVGQAMRCGCAARASVAGCEHRPAEHCAQAAALEPEEIARDTDHRPVVETI